MHLMSAGRLQLYDKPAGPRDRTSRLLHRPAREAGGASCACASSAPSRPRGSSCFARTSSRRSEALATLGPEAWPDPAAPRAESAARRAAARCTRVLRDQHVIAGIGRSWVDEILWQAQLSPYKRGADLDVGEAERLSDAMRRDARAARSRTTSRRSACRSPTSCRCRCRCTATRASRVRAAATTLQGRALRGLRDRLLPDVPDRRPRAQGPAPVAAAALSRTRRAVVRSDLVWLFGAGQKLDWRSRTSRASKRRR